MSGHQQQQDVRPHPAGHQQQPDGRAPGGHQSDPRGRMDPRAMYAPGYVPGPPGRDFPMSADRQSMQQQQQQHQQQQQLQQQQQRPTGPPANYPQHYNTQMQLQMQVSPLLSSANTYLCTVPILLTSVADPGCFPGSELYPSRILDQNLFNPGSPSKNLTQKTVSKLSDPDLDFFYPFWIPDPGVKKALAPRSGSATLLLTQRD
jgi:hypothetical protein